jgi:hypothetical protein
MAKNSDDREVVLGYASGKNISFRGKIYPGYTWGVWRALSQKERDEAIEEELFELVDVWVEDDEESEETG